MPTILAFHRDEEERAHIVSLLRERGDEWRVVEASDTEELLDGFEHFPVELVVCEQAITESDCGTLDRLCRNHPNVPLLVISDESPERVNALLMGAASYIPRSSMARDLVVVVNRLLTLAGCRRRHARLLDGLTATEVKFRIANNDRTMIPVLCGHLVDGLEEFAIRGEGRRIQVAVALEEAMTNAIVHGNLEVSSRLREPHINDYERTIEERRESPPYAHRLVSVTGRYTSDVATIDVRDEGPGFDPSAVESPIDPENIDRPHGRGLYLIRAFTDEVRFNETGNVITLVFRRKGPRPTAADPNGGAPLDTDCADECDDEGLPIE